MIRTLVLLASLCATLVAAAPGRIVGGEDAFIEEFPYQLSMLRFGKHSCGASVVSETFAVTAAHCTWESLESDLSLRAGSSYFEEGGVVYPVKKIHQHPLYINTSSDHDISLLEIEGQFEYSESVAPAVLAETGTEPAAGADAVITGWGRLYTDGPLPHQLQKVTVQIISREDCQAQYGRLEKITVDMICAGVSGGGKDSCQGDSGGPITVDGVLVGLVSWGIGCATARFPGVYTDVAYYRDYIDETANL